MSDRTEDDAEHPVRGDVRDEAWDLIASPAWRPPSPRTPFDVTPPVLVGLDGGVGGELALEWALREAQEQGAPVRAVTAWSWDARLLAAVGGRAARQVEQARQLQEEQLARVLRRFGPVHCRIETVLGEGDAASLLLEESRRARLLVVGSHAEPGGATVGSVARACVRLASCPVVVVPVRLTA
ncbi:universal stress protein [Kineosporia sp. A_224]|uniref:universal stress protein n=1 Tax=Kineosporia sp. A_224 TaxID=1962180 RepID=UPI000B4AAFCF|nr:universal stress protein [Kineosporia sp. A_224]